MRTPFRAPPFTRAPAWRGSDNLGFSRGGVQTIWGSRVAGFRQSDVTGVTIEAPGAVFGQKSGPSCLESANWVGQVVRSPPTGWGELSGARQKGAADAGQPNARRQPPRSGAPSAGLSHRHVGSGDVAFK